MALPYEGDTSGRHGAYELTEQCDETKPTTSNRRLSSIPSIALFVIAMVVVVLLLACLPVIFLLTSSEPEKLQQMDNVVSIFHDGDQDYWPVDADTPQDREHKHLHADDILPQNISVCRGVGFMCSGFPSIIVGDNKRCDGNADCPDGSDELDCNECRTSFSCHLPTDPKSKVCLRGPMLCDGTSHCSQRVDEEQFCRAKCSEGEFKCPNQDMCLPHELLCDGDEHCITGADELNCNGTCVNGAKWCSVTEKCIPKWMLCDGETNCSDGSDEQECDCKQCSGNDKALCELSDMCILKEQVCDGVPNCLHGEDEEGCPGQCSLGNKTEMVKCGQKEYPVKYACGGMIRECAGACDSCYESTAFDCGDKTCMPRSVFCDGRKDCPNGSDEENCDLDPQNSFTCRHKLANGKAKTIKKEWVCDGFKDCPFGDDENNCTACVGNDTIRCEVDRKCLTSLSLCNGVEECSDGSDELNCSCEMCNQHPFESYNCETGSRCFRTNQVCNPYSRCPDASKKDKLYCAVKLSPVMFF